MKIVGGTYTEQCENPEFQTLTGSGMRAAASLISVAPDLHLVTAIHPTENLAADITASELEIKNVTWLERTLPIGFSYFTPLTAPSVGGIGSRLAPGTVPDGTDDELTLVFGMLEEPSLTATARRVVLDPQRPRGLQEAHLPVIKSETTAWTLNERETRQLGGAGSVRDAARNLVNRDGVDVVVTKRGPLGAMVTTPERQVSIGPHLTDTVFPIGSGDVFAAAFAWAWGLGGADEVEAARVGSAAAAHWCETLEYPTPRSILAGNITREELPTDDEALVYLAGPFFNLQQRMMIDLARWALAPNVFSPLHEVGVGGIEVAMKDLEGLERCHSVLALVDDDDPGTIFEVGYATKMGIPVIGYAENVHPEGRKMMAGTGAELTDDISTAVYRAVWAAARYRSGQLRAD